MDIPIGIAKRINPDLDAVASSHIFKELRGINNNISSFPIPLKPKDFPLISWTHVKLSWQNNDMDHAYMRIVLVSPAWTVPMSPPITVKHNVWTPLEWALPSILLENCTIAIQVDLDPMHANHYIQFKLLGFEHLLPRVPNYLFANEEGKLKWRLINCHNGGLIEEINEFHGEEGSFLTLKPLI